jgi:hypothetical protein
MTPAQCCAFSAKMGVGWTVFEGAMEPYHPCPKDNACCIVFGEVTSSFHNATSVAAGAISGTNARKAKGRCQLFSKVDGHKRAAGAVSGGSMYEDVPPLYASWPSGSPWVTAVGATRFEGQAVGNAEMATDKFGSGGGFSKFVPMVPNAGYQAADVAAYLARAPKGAPFPPADAFDPTMRANPDVAALGEGFQILLGGKRVAIGGTSASTPLFSGLVSLLNEARLQKGKPPMGFLNPWMYQNKVRRRRQGVPGMPARKPALAPRGVAAHPGAPRRRMRSRTSSRARTRSGAATTRSSTATTAPRAGTRPRGWARPASTRCSPPR